MNTINQAAVLLERAGVRYTLNEPLAGHTTFGIGGPAALFCRPDSAQRLAAAAAAARRCALPAYCLGKGSNVLFSDEGFPGMVIRPEMNRVAAEGQTLTAECGAALDAACEAALAAGLTGLEFAWGIPGSVGGAVYMNAGAFGGEVAGVLLRAECLDENGGIMTLEAGRMELGYRASVFQKKPWTVLSAVFGLARGGPESIRAEMDRNLAYRRARQPLGLPSAGSAFKRPKGAYAAALIERCGLRGARVGGAAVDAKHCGFIVNLGGATCRDVLQLAQRVADTVKAETGFVLEKEIRVVEAGRGWGP